MSKKSMQRSITMTQEMRDRLTLLVIPLIYSIDM